MQGGAGVARACQAAAAERDRLHPEVAPVFLHRDVGGELRDAEDRVQALIDRHRLGNAGRVRMRGIDVPPRLALDERQ